MLRALWCDVFSLKFRARYSRRLNDLGGTTTTTYLHTSLPLCCKSFFASKYARARARTGGVVHAVHGQTRPRAYRTPGSGSSLVASTGTRVYSALPRRRSQCSHPSGTRRPNTGFCSGGILRFIPLSLPLSP